MTNMNFAYFLTYGLLAAALIVLWLFFAARLLVVARLPIPVRNVRRRILAAVAVTVAGVIWLSSDTAQMARWPSIGTTAFAAASISLSDAQRSLLGARQWLNTQPLRPEDLRGKVVLVNFWTYSCINSLRALPYIRAWAEKYKDRGLVVIGVHTPEFGFEKDVANVHQAVSSLGVSYPVAIDSDRRIWRGLQQ
jgi:thiol-disulfide isomerase/thioredoxin